MVTKKVLNKKNCIFNYQYFLDYSRPEFSANGQFARKMHQNSIIFSTMVSLRTFSVELLWKHLDLTPTFQIVSEYYKFETLLTYYDSVQSTELNTFCDKFWLFKSNFPVGHTPNPSVVRLWKNVGENTGKPTHRNVINNVVLKLTPAKKISCRSI